MKRLRLKTVLRSLLLLLEYKNIVRDYLQDVVIYVGKKDCMFITFVSKIYNAEKFCKLIIVLIIEVIHMLKY